MTMNKQNDEDVGDHGTAALDENHRMQAFVDEEQATNTETWWEKSPWGGKGQSDWDLKEIEFLKHEYHITKNPVYIWTALQIAMELPEPSPNQSKLFREARGWIDEYLSDSASRLSKAVENPPSTHVGNEIAKAFGFTLEPGKGSPLSDAQKRLRDWRLALQVWRRLRIERYKETLAVKYVADVNGVGESIVGAAWRDFKKRPR
jgi:hypothetical protein